MIAKGYRISKCSKIDCSYGASIQLCDYILEMGKLCESYLCKSIFKKYHECLEEEHFCLTHDFDESLFSWNSFYLSD
jgi:hypothetical protein